MTKDIEVKWHERARARIAPRTAEDLGSKRRYHWHCKNWQEVAAAIPNMFQQVTSPDEDVTAAIARVQAWKEEPSLRSDPLDIAVLFAVMSADRVADWAASHFGLAALVPLLVRPPLFCEWTSGTRVLTRKPKLAPEVRLLRVLVVQADAKARAAARQAAQALWDEGDVQLHEELAYAFFFDEDLRKQALAEILDQAPAFTNVQLTLARDEASIRKLVARRNKGEPLEYVELVASLGEGALAMLLEMAGAVRGTDPHVSHALAMTCLLCEESAKHLSTTISHPSTRDVISEFFTKHHALAKKVLPVAAAGASRNAALAKALLLKIAGPEKAAADVPLVGLADPAVPQVLRDAPWLDPKPAIVDLGIDLDAWPASVSLTKQREEAGLAWFAKEQGSAETMSPEEVTKFLAATGTNTLQAATYEGKCIPEEILLERFNAGKGNYEMIVPMLAKLGARALPGYRHMLTSLRWIGNDIVMAADDPHLALPLLQQENSYWWWHLAHPRSAAVGLLAAAPREPIAAIAIRRLARAGHRDVILEVAKQTKAPDAVSALLERDPRLDVVRVAAQTSTHACSHPHLKDGRALDDDVVRRILEMLSMPLNDETYAGIDDVRAACDRRSLAEMAWDLAALADGGGVRRAQSRFPEWMRWSLRHLADDEVIRRMTPALKHATIYAVLEALARDGDRAALIELATAQEREDVTGALGRVAAAKRTTADELVESMLPTTPLEPEGTTSLVYGAATLRVGFDTTLAPVLYSGEKRLASLPRAKASDDPIAIRLAKEHWEELKEDVRSIAHLRAHALEDAMRTARRIPAPHFIAGWATHPLGKHQARGVVWAVERASELVTFRVAEDSTLADIDDHELVLQPDDFVRVPHPAELAPELVNRWATIMNDYGLMQPVAQLGRTPIAVTPEELASTKIERPVKAGVTWTIYRRVLRDHQGARPMVRCPGQVSIEQEATWSSGAYNVTKVRVTAKVDEKPVALGTLHPVELAEALYAMRLAIEAE